VPVGKEEVQARGGLARGPRVSRQTMTTRIRLLGRDGLGRREPDPEDGRAAGVVLTAKARRFEPVARRTLEELGGRAQERLGERRLQSVKAALKEWIET